MKWMCYLLLLFILIGSVEGTQWVNRNTGQATPERGSAPGEAANYYIACVEKYGDYPICATTRDSDPDLPEEYSNDTVKTYELADKALYEKLKNDATLIQNLVVEELEEKEDNKEFRAKIPSYNGTYFRVVSAQGEQLQVGSGGSAFEYPIDPDDLRFTGEEVVWDAMGGNAEFSDGNIQIKDENGENVRLLTVVEKNGEAVGYRSLEQRDGVEESYVLRDVTGEEILRTTASQGTILFGGNVQNPMDIARLLAEHNVPIDEVEKNEGEEEEEEVYAWGQDNKISRTDGKLEVSYTDGSQFTYEAGRLTKYEYTVGDDTTTTITYDNGKAKLEINGEKIKDAKQDAIEFTPGPGGLLRAEVKVDRDGKTQTRTLTIGTDGTVTITGKDGTPHLCKETKKTGLDCQGWTRAVREAMREKYEKTKKEPKGPSETLFTRLNEILRGYSQYSGLGFWTGLFTDEEEVQEQTQEMIEDFCDTILLGNQECWTSKICQANVDATMGGTGVVTQASYQEPPEAAAHLEVTKSQPITFFNESLGREITQYLYRISFTLHNPNEQPMFYNIEFTTADDTTRQIFQPWKNLTKGGATQAVHDFALTQYSQRNYTDVCMRFTPGIPRTGGGTARHLCNPITTPQFQQAIFEPLAPTSSSEGPTTPPERRDFDDF